MLIGNPVFFDIPPPEMTLFFGGGAGGIFGASSPDPIRGSTPHIQLIMEQVESILNILVHPEQGDQELFYLENEPIPIDVMDRKPETGPGVSFKRYHITIYPESNVFDEEPRIGGRINRYYRVGISLFRKVPRKSRKRMFSNTSDSTSGVGIFEFGNTVMDALRNNTLGSLVNMTAGKQFEVEFQDTDEDFLERIDITHLSEMLHTTVGGVP